MADGLHVFTCAAVNYLPKVRILCHSIRRHHPEAVIHFALADERPQWLRTEDEPFDSILGIERLGIPDCKNWTFTHSIVELSTAIKPFALKHLLQLPDCATVLYFDPDMVLFSRVDDILATLATSNVALTPHQTKPEQTLDAILDNEVASLKHGIFNLGFIGVRNTAEGRRFADWWAERTYHLCWADVENGLFTDQKWINFAPVFFDGVAIIKSSRHNVATWNLTTRRMTGTLAAGFEVDGEPLGFYHFTGFDSGAHRIMAIKNASASPAVQELITWYEGETAVADRDPVAEWPWAFGRFSDGTPIEPGHRRVYRDHDDLRKAFPEPYDAGTDRSSFLGWCRTEGKVRYPELFAEGGTRRAPKAARMGTRVSLADGAPTVRPDAARRRAARRCASAAGWCSGAKASAASRGDCTGRAGRGGRDRRHHPGLQGAAADASLHRRRAEEPPGARRSRSSRSTTRAPTPTSRATSTSLPRKGVSRSCATRAISASCSRSTAAWRSIPTGTWSCSTATRRWRTTGSTACGMRRMRIRDVGTVTPFSNNATICSYPFEGWTGGVPGTLGLATLDRLFASTNAGRTVDLPTAVGFCMFIRRACLDQVGLFDALRFGRGYGEENDFCMRAARAGWRNVLAGDVFVYHEGGVSFSGERLALTENAGRMLAELYPDYLQKVREFLRYDPAGTLRAAVDGARIAQDESELRQVLAERIEERALMKARLTEAEIYADEREPLIAKLRQWTGARRDAALGAGRGNRAVARRT